MSFETEMTEHLNDIKDANKGNYKTFTESTQYPDYSVLIIDSDKKTSSFLLEVKEKKQPYKNWAVEGIPEEETFLLDELTVRKLLYWSKGFKGCFGIKDTVRGKYFLLTLLDIISCPVIRSSRKVKTHGGSEIEKGKRIIDLRWAKECEECFDLLKNAHEYCLNDLEGIVDKTECYGNYINENFIDGGMTRTLEHRKQDFENK